MNALPQPVERHAGTVHLAAALHPFRTARVDCLAPAGGTLAELLAGAGIDPGAGAAGLWVWVNDRHAPPETWAGWVLAEGDLVAVRAVPQGGGNGGKVTRAVLTIAVIAAAVYTGGAAAGLLAGTLGATGAAVAGAAVSAGVLYGGMLAINAIVPPPVPQLSGRNATSPSRSPSLTGTRNEYRPYQAVPRVYGRVKMYPPLAALPYTELVGQDQYLNQVFTFGTGPLALDTDTFRIGETLLTDFEGVEVEVREGRAADPPLTLYTSDVFEEAPGVTLVEGADWSVRTTQAGISEVSLEIAFPVGLIFLEDNGHRHPVVCDFQMQTSPAGAGTWTAPTRMRVSSCSETGSGGFRVGAAQAETLRIGVAFGVAAGQHDVRLRFVSADQHSTGNDQAIGVDWAGTEPVWTALRSIKPTAPVALAGQALVALRIKATDQLSGVVDRFNATATSLLPVWTGSAWEEQATRNPAWCYLDVLRGAANKRAVADDARFDLAGLKDWADACAASGFTCDAVVDFDTTVFALLRDIAALGRAGFGMADGRFSVVRDREQTQPVQLFSPRNSWGFRSAKAFPDPPQALRVRFMDYASGWVQAERVVFADGYHAGNATRYEELELWGVSDGDLAWKIGRYYLAVGQLRPEVYELNCDAEHLVCTRGDLVRVAHDVPLWGYGWGRLKSVDLDGNGHAVGVLVDELLPFVAGKTYVARIRRQDGSQALVNLTHPGEGETASLAFAAPLNPPCAPGDLLLFGELGRETAELIVKSVDPGPDLTARLTLVDHAPAVHAADQGAIPPWDPLISAPVALADKSLPAPVILAVQADWTTHDATTGHLLPRIVVTVRVPAGYVLPTVQLEAQFRLHDPADAAPWLRAGFSPAGSPTVVIAPVTLDRRYDVRLRLVSEAGLTSPWAVASAVLVGMDTQAPPAPTGLAASFTTRVTWTWDRSPAADFNHYEVSLDNLAWSRQETNAAEILNPTVRSYTLWVKASDHTGNLSPAASATATLAAPLAVDPGDLVAVVAENQALLSVLRTRTKSAGHRGYRFRWSLDQASWAEVGEDPQASVLLTVPAASFGGAAQLTVYAQAAEADAVGDGPWGAAKSITVYTPLQSAPLDLKSWTHTMVFSATDYSAVAWTSGSLYVSGQPTYTINAGSVGMGNDAVRYIYFDLDLSLTALQVTTDPLSAIGGRRVLVAVAQRVADTTKKATFQVMGQVGSNPKLITGDVIAANQIVGNHLAANMIYTGNLEIDGAGQIKSSNYVAGTTGFRVLGTGAAEFNSVTVRGNIQAGSGSSVPLGYVAGAGALAALGSIDYSSGYLTGTKPPASADNTLAAVNGGVISGGYLVLSNGTYSVIVGGKLNTFTAQTILPSYVTIDGQTHWYYWSGAIWSEVGNVGRNTHGSDITAAFFDGSSWGLGLLAQNANAYPALQGYNQVGYGTVGASSSSAGLYGYGPICARLLTPSTTANHLHFVPNGTVSAAPTDAAGAGTLRCVEWSADNTYRLYFKIEAGTTGWRWIGYA